MAWCISLQSHDDFMFSFSFLEGTYIPKASVRHPRKVGADPHQNRTKQPNRQTKMEVVGALGHIPIEIHIFHQPSLHKSVSTHPLRGWQWIHGAKNLQVVSACYSCSVEPSRIDRVQCVPTKSGRTESLGTTEQEKTKRV